MPGRLRAILAIWVGAPRDEVSKLRAPAVFMEIAGALKGFRERVLRAAPRARIWLSGLGEYDKKEHDFLDAILHEADPWGSYLSKWFEANS